MSKEVSTVQQDAADLAKLGYKQELQRNLSFFANFAIAFSFISATTGIFSYFGYGLKVGGPAFIWTWPLAFVGQLLVALTMAEVASHYPIAGSIYQWGKHLVGSTYSWFAGWIYLIALLATIAAVDFSAAPFIAPFLDLKVTSTNLILITAGMVILQTLINAYGVRLTAFINQIGLFAEVVAMIVLAVILFAVGVHQPVSFTFNTAGLEGTGSYLPVFVGAILMSVWTLFGFDAAGSLAEEVVNPRRAVPKAIVTSLIVTFIVGGLALLAMVLAIPDLNAAMKSDNPINYILGASLGGSAAKIVVIVAVIAMFICGTAVQATASRLLYSFGRDNKVPGSKLWARVSHRFETPVSAILFSGLFVILLTSVDKLVTNAETFILSITVVGIYLAYLTVSVGSLIARARGWDATTSPWNLGKWGVWVNLLAVIWGVFVIGDLCWPVTPGTPWYINYAVPLIAVVVLVVGALYYFAAVAPREGKDKEQQAA